MKWELAEFKVYNDMIFFKFQWPFILLMDKLLLVSWIKSITEWKIELIKVDINIMEDYMGRRDRLDELNRITTAVIF